MNLSAPVAGLLVMFFWLLCMVVALAVCDGAKRPESHELKGYEEYIEEHHDDEQDR